MGENYHIYDIQESARIKMGTLTCPLPIRVGPISHRGDAIQFHSNFHQTCVNERLSVSLSLTLD